MKKSAFNSHLYRGCYFNTTFQKNENGSKTYKIKKTFFKYSTVVIDERVKLSEGGCPPSLPGAIRLSDLMRGAPTVGFIVFLRFNQGTQVNK